jgi:hypothetical protein
MEAVRIVGVTLVLVLTAVLVLALAARVGARMRRNRADQPPRSLSGRDR